MKTPAAIIESVFAPAVRAINALEQRICAAEDAADGQLWEQARIVVELLDAGLSQQALADQWINPRTGKPHAKAHVCYVAKLYRVQCTEQPRPRFREAYNAIANAPGSKVNRLLHQTGDAEWYSPADVVAAARDVLGTIDLDPASSPAANRVVQAAQIFTTTEDGRSHHWRGRVFLNPPYRQPEIAQFCEKFAHHARVGDISGIVLVNNATDTQWFATLADVASAFCFPTGRFRYWHADRDDNHTALQGQVLVYTGPDRAAFCRRFAPLGLVLVPPA
jgi:hypothetical protein